MEQIDIDFYIHGVTTSFNYWGTSEEDAQYLKIFYGGTKKDDHARMIVKYQKPANGSYRTYYNYIVDANVKNSESRSDSYIGLTISLKQLFCKDIRKIYQLLEYIFNTYVVGNILQRVGDSWKYSISDFRSEETLVEKIFEEVVVKSFTPLIHSCIDINEVNNGGCPKLDLCSYDENDFAELIKKHGQFIVSPFYESLAEQQTKANCDKLIAEKEQNWLAEKNQLHQNVQSVKEEKAKLNIELEEMKKKLKNATSENQRLASENQKYQDSRRMEEILKSHEFQDLVKLLRQYAPRVEKDISIKNYGELPPTNKSNKKMYLLEAGVVIFLVISGLLGWQLIDANDMLAKEQEQNKRTRSELTNYKTANARLQSSLSLNRIGNDYSIDIEGSSAPLKTNGIYTLKALNNSKTGYWQIAGANVDIKSLEQRSVKIVPKEKGRLTVRYFMDNEYFERNIAVE